MNVFDGKGLCRFFLGFGNGKIDQIKTVFLRNFKCRCIKTVAVVMLLPAFVEAAPAPEEVTPKLGNGGAMLLVDGQKQVSGTDGHSGGLQSGDLVVERGAEGGASGSTANLEVVAPLDVANKGSQQQGANDGVEISKEGFDHWWWAYVAIALSPLFMSGAMGAPKPNVMFSGARLPRVRCN